MSLKTAWDSLRAHNGCLKLFDIKDLSAQIRRLSMKQEQERAASEDVRPRQYRFRRVDPAELLRQQMERQQMERQQQAGAEGEGAAATSSSQRRVLLPAVQTEDEATVGADIASFLEEKSKGGGRVLGGDGLVVFVSEAEGKVRVMRDRRTKADLLAAFPDIDEGIVEEVWARTRLFAAASTILTSLRNSGHVELAHHLNIDLRLDDPAVWPTLEEVFGAGGGGGGTTAEGHPLAASGASSSATTTGWEHVALPDGGDNWVLIEEEAGAALGAPGPLTVADMAALAFGREEEEEEAGAEEQEEQQRGRGAPTGAGQMDYRKALVSNLMDGDDGSSALLAARRVFPPAAAARRKRAKVDAAAAAAEDDDWEGGGGGGGGGWHEEYVLQKAVSVRTRKHCGRKRLTETGKLRMAAKAAKRQAAAAAPAGGGGGSDSEGDAMEW